MITKSKLLFILCFILSIFITTENQATTLYSTGVSNWRWTNTSSWTYNSNGSGTCGCTPAPSDIIIIRSTDSIAVTTDVNIAGVLTIQVYGVLHLRAKLDISGAATVVNIYSGARLNSDGSNSTRLRISGSGSSEYQGGEGTLTGPWTIVDGLSSSNTSLPVAFISFSGNNFGNSILLKWTTSYEFNNAYFEILKSTDGKTFNSVGKVNASLVHSYQFEDPSVSASENYYRLKQVDYDGIVSYSNIILVSAENIPAITIFPNPAEGNNFKILLGKGTSQYTISLINQQGQLIETKKELGGIIDGSTFSNLTSSGIYFLVISNGSEQITKKIIVQ